MQDCSVQEFDLSSGSLVCVECDLGDFDPLVFGESGPMQVCAECMCELCVACMCMFGNLALGNYY